LQEKVLKDKIEEDAIAKEELRRVGFFMRK